jgi:hypothetical protein
MLSNDVFDMCKSRTQWGFHSRCGYNGLSGQGSSIDIDISAMWVAVKEAEFGRRAPECISSQHHINNTKGKEINVFVMVSLSLDPEN